MSLMRRLTKIVTIIAVVMMCVTASPIYALSTADTHAVTYDTNFFDDTVYAGPTTCNTGTTVLSGSDNQQKAYNYFVAKSLTPIQSAAIIGNLMQESSVNPNSVQKGGPGRGIAQWSVDGRWIALQALAASQGKSATDLGLQLDFMWQELTGSYKGALASLKATTDISIAVTVFEQQYEAAGNPQLDTRLRYAQSVLALYGGGASPGGTISAGGCGGGLGVDGDFTFPERTTQKAITTHQPAWCFSSQVSCHHTYVAADIFNNEGTGVVAAKGGTVLKAVETSCDNPNRFNVPSVQISGSDGKYYYYTHMKPGSIKVHTGQAVTGGQDLGVLGPTKCAEDTPPHIHFQMSSKIINNTSDLTERPNYIDPQPSLVAAFNKLPAE